MVGRAIAVLALGGCVACAPVLVGSRAWPGTSDRGDRPWIARDLPPPPRVGATTLPEGITPQMLEGTVVLTLPDVLALAISNDPRARAAWAAAKAEAANVGVARAGWLPSLALTGDASYLHQEPFGGRFVLSLGQLVPGVQLSWLVADFGGRAGRIAAAEAGLVAANFTHTRALQTVVYQVEQSYLQFLAAQALVAASEVTIAAAQETEAAAKARAEAGLATRADVLQASTSLARAVLDREGIVGQLDQVKGALAVAAGVPQLLKTKVVLQEPVVPMRELTEEAEALVARAYKQRPDLSAAQARVMAARGLEAAAGGARWPVVSLSAEASPSFFRDVTQGTNGFANNYSAGVRLALPLFDGFETQYRIRGAQAEREVRTAEAEALAQEVSLDVWNSLVAMRTALVRIRATTELATSAAESHEVALGRYREGVGSVLELLAAQDALASARAGVVQARAQWFLASGQLAYALGTWLPEGASLTGRSP